MDKRKADLGSTYPAGHPSGRIWQPPASVEQARARVLNAMDLLEANCADDFEVGYAMRIYNEAVDDYASMVITGEIDEAPVAALTAEIRELADQIAVSEAEAVVLEAMRDIDGEAL